MRRVLKYSIILIFASILFLMKSNDMVSKEIIEIETINYSSYTDLGYSHMDLKRLQNTLTPNQFESILKKKIPRYILFSYLRHETFNFDEIDYYEQIRQKKDVSYQAAINLYHHPHITTNFYDHIRPSINLYTPLILVNKNYALPEDYVPNDLVFTEGIPLLVDDSTRYYLNIDAYNALKRLFDNAKDKGLKLYLSNGYRSYKKQDEIYQFYKSRRDNVDLISARPGHSEHQTGLALDLTCKDADYFLSETFAFTKEGLFIKDNAHRYGFIIRYPNNKVNTTGYQYEPWHLRYVGKKAASIIYQKEITLEEYLIYYTDMPI